MVPLEYLLLSDISRTLKVKVVKIASRSSSVGGVLEAIIEAAKGSPLVGDALNLSESAELFVTASIHHNEDYVLGPLSSTTSRALSNPEHQTDEVRFHEWLSFACRYRDLSPHSRVSIVVWMMSSRTTSANESIAAEIEALSQPLMIPLATCSIPLFNPHGKLQSGRHLLQLELSDALHSAISPSQAAATLGSALISEQTEPSSSTSAPADDTDLEHALLESAQSEWRSQPVKCLDQLDRLMSSSPFLTQFVGINFYHPSVQWQLRLAPKRADDFIRSVAHGGTSTAAAPLGNGKFVRGTALPMSSPTQLFLYIDLPAFPVPVIYHQKPVCLPPPPFLISPNAPCSLTASQSLSDDSIASVSTVLITVQQVSQQPVPVAAAATGVAGGGAGANGAAATATATAASSSTQPTDNQSPTVPAAQSVTSAGNAAALTAGAVAAAANPAGPITSTRRPLCFLYDPASKLMSPVEAMYSKLQRSIGGGALVRPSIAERKQLQSLLAKITPLDRLTSSQRDQIWRFRHSLTEEPRALPLLFRCVQWSEADEIDEMCQLMDKWKPLSVDESILLFTGITVPISIRRRSLQWLDQATDDEIMSYLLYLVQALRYEASGAQSDSLDVSSSVAAAAVSTSSASSASSSTTTHPFDELLDLEPALHEHSTMAQSDQQRYSTGATQASRLPLAEFLCNRCAQSLQLASLLHWYLVVECSDVKLGALFRAVHALFVRTLCSTEKSRPILLQLERQHRLVAALTSVIEDVKTTVKSKKSKELKARLLELMKSDSGAPHYRLLSNFPATPLPYDASIHVNSLLTEQCGFFSSNKVPMRVVLALDPAMAESFQLQQQQQQPSVTPPQFATLRRKPNSATMRALPGVQTMHTTIFKTGDDLRQDQLVLSLLALCDSLLKRIHLDLCLTPYRVVATSTDTGFVEFVHQSSPLSAVIADHNGDIAAYLEEHNKKSEFSRFVSSSQH